MCRLQAWTRTGYRELINEVPGYMHFLRTLIATSTVLYIGFSFSDGYLNEVRGEVLSMLYGSSSSNATERGFADRTGSSPRTAEAALVSSYMRSGRCMTQPLGYAIVHDKSSNERDFFLTHEGVQILSWNTNGGNGKKDYAGLDKYLHNIYTLTSPYYYLGKLAWGHRILMLMKDYTAESDLPTAPDNGAHYLSATDLSQSQRNAVVASSPHVRAVQTLRDARRKRMSDLPKLLDESLCKYRSMRVLMKEGDTASVYSEGSADSAYDDEDADGEDASRKLPYSDRSKEYEDGGKLHIVYDSVDDAIECMKKVKYDFVVTVYGWRSESECLLNDFVSKMRLLPFDRQAPFIVTTTSEGLRQKHRMCTKMGASDVAISFEQLVNAVMHLLRRMQVSESKF